MNAPTLQPTIGKQARAIIERDHKIMATSYGREYPLVVAKASGSEVWDVDGRRYIDLMAGVSVLNVGHGHPKVVEAVKKQIDEFWHVCLMDFYYPQAVELAEKLAQLAPMSGKTRYYFGNSGTEAVESAVKLATYHTGRTKFIGFLGAFHGRTLGSLSFTASKRTQSAHYPTGVQVYHIPYPYEYRPLLAQQAGEDVGASILRYLREELFRTKLEPTDVAAILLEPIQGEGGYVVPTPGFVAGLRQICDEYGILLISDEIQSGVGRTGKWWAIEHEGVEPDIVCFAKGIASGLPLGGIMAKESVMTWKPGAHGSTFGGNPVALAAALATLEVIETEGLLEQAHETGAYIQQFLRQLQSQYPVIGEVRGRGLMVGVEFVEDAVSKKRNSTLRNAIIEGGFERGALMIPCGPNTIRFTPPLNISRALVDEGLSIFADALHEAVA